MNRDELSRLAELDRSEHITLSFAVQDGRLTQSEVDWQVPTWFVNGQGAHTLAHHRAFCRDHLEKGGIMLGAFEGDLLVGVAVVRPRLQNDMAQLAFLHVSRDFRRRGIAGKLMQESCKIARAAGARQVYVSATPSGSAVGFYLSQGCRLVEDPDPDLYALEPEDIHLILDL